MPYTAGASLGGLRADLGSIPLGGVDGSGVAWSLMEMEGWDSPEVRAEVQQRESDHGAWSAPVYLGERVLTLTGTITAPDRAGLESAMEQLRSAAALQDTVLVVYESTPKQCIVRRSGKPLIRYTSDRIGAYSLLMTAADPRRYSLDVSQGTTGLPSTTGGLAPPLTPPLTIGATTVAGSITATNLGSIDTRPVLTITGPVTAPQVLAQMPDGSVRFLNYSQALGSGETLTIDLDSHAVVLNGNVSRRRYLTTPLGWPVIPPAASVTFQFRAAAPNPAALLSMQWRSAWI